MRRATRVPVRRSGPFVLSGRLPARGPVTDEILEELADRLLRFVAEPRPPLTIGELAAALGADPLRCGQAILALHRRGRLWVAPLPDDRFELRPTAAEALN
jgi:hypothetical protein